MTQENFRADSRGDKTSQPGESGLRQMAGLSSLIFSLGDISELFSNAGANVTECDI